MILFFCEINSILQINSEAFQTSELLCEPFAWFKATDQYPRWDLATAYAVGWSSLPGCMWGSVFHPLECSEPTSSRVFLKARLNKASGHDNRQKCTLTKLPHCHALWDALNCWASFCASKTAGLISLLVLFLNDDSLAAFCLVHRISRKVSHDQVTSSGPPSVQLEVLLKSFIIQRETVRLSVNNDLGRFWKEAVVAWLNVASHCLLGGTEENHKSLFVPRF
jgi:hypothetical protein